MNMQVGHGFWEEMSRLATTNPMQIDRPKGSRHPRWEDMIYPLDYGFLENTSAADGGGIDVWLGSLASRTLTGILCTFDINKRDAEIKLLLGCTEADLEIITNFYSSGMRCLIIKNPLEPYVLP